MNEILLALVAAMMSPAGQEADIVFAGDAMQHIAQIEAARRSDGSYDYSGYFDAVTPYVSGADYAVLNLETPLGGKPYTGYPCFCAPDSYAGELKKAGFDLFLTANNHTLDRRHKGLIRTVQVLDSLGISHVGTYPDAESRLKALPLIKDINGFKVGFLNYTYGTNGIPVTGDVVVDFIDRNVISRDVEAARAAGAELIAVCMHWGVEYVMLPNNEQRRLADFLTDLGVDMIIGGHPHVIQPMEIRRSEKYDKNVFLCYSLGNYISNMKRRDTRGGAMARVTLHRDSLGNARVKEARYSLVFTEPPSASNRNFRLTTPEECTSVWKPQCNAFEKSAMQIFDKHNISVPRESASRPRQ